VAIPLLKQQSQSFHPAEFYLTGVTFNATNQQHAARVTLEAARAFLNDCVVSNPTLHPIVINIKKLSVTETSRSATIISGKIELAFSFGLKREFDTVQLVAYEGSSVYTRAVTQQDASEPLLRHLLLSSLNWFDTWINKQAPVNPLLAKKVILTFADYTEKPEGDTIYYSVKRPLTWDDFRGKPSRNPYSAEVFTTIGYTEQVEVKNGIIYVRLNIKTDLPKSAAWANHNARDNYTLNHEQRHFDISRIMAERFKRNLAAEQLPVFNYDAPINEEFLNALRQLTAMQLQYDKETAHGIDHTAQEEWNIRIDKELKSLGIKGN
jgi:hypothetical protein